MKFQACPSGGCAWWVCQSTWRGPRERLSVHTHGYSEHAPYPRARAPQAMQQMMDQAAKGGGAPGGASCVPGRAPADGRAELCCVHGGATESQAPVCLEGSPLFATGGLLDPICFRCLCSWCRHTSPARFMLLQRHAAAGPAHDKPEAACLRACAGARPSARRRR
jgi:hypothetical protein